MASLSEQAYRKLKDMVIEAPPGTFFSVRKCAEELELSYTPTREALLRLHSEGLLNLIPKVGFFTAQMNLRDITDIHQSRECIEKYVLPIVLPHLRQEDKDILYSFLEEQKQALEAGDSNLSSEKDVEFHCYLIDLLNNKRISDFYRSIRSQYRAGTNNLVKKSTMVPLEEHKKFMRLIEEGRYEEAVRVMEEHGRNAIQRMREGFVRIGC